MNSKYNVSNGIKAQEKYCNENNLPHFAPTNGQCWKCKRNIYEPVGWKNEYDSYGIPLKRVQVALDSPEKEFETGITVEKAGKTLITGCPHCNKSYCD